MLRFVTSFRAMTSFIISVTSQVLQQHWSRLNSINHVFFQTEIIIIIIMCKKKNRNDSKTKTVINLIIHFQWKFWKLFSIKSNNTMFKIEIVRLDIVVLNTIMFENTAISILVPIYKIRLFTSSCITML